MSSCLGLTWLMSFLYTLRKIDFYFKPHYYQQDVDDIFILFTSPEHLEAF